MFEIPITRFILISILCCTPNWFETIIFDILLRRYYVFLNCLVLCFEVLQSLSYIWLFQGSFFIRKVVTEYNFPSFEMSKFIRQWLSLNSKGTLKENLLSNRFTRLDLIAPIHSDVDILESDDYECKNEWSSNISWLSFF